MPTDRLIVAVAVAVVVAAVTFSVVSLSLRLVFYDALRTNEIRLWKPFLGRLRRQAIGLFVASVVPLVDRRWTDRTGGTRRRRGGGAGRMGTDRLVRGGGGIALARACDRRGILRERGRLVHSTRAPAHLRIRRSRDDRRGYRRDRRMAPNLGRGERGVGGGTRLPRGSLFVRLGTAIVGDRIRDYRFGGCRSRWNRTLGCGRSPRRSWRVSGHDRRN